jgi:hypothetical protein
LAAGDLEKTVTTIGRLPAFSMREPRLRARGATPGEYPSTSATGWPSRNTRNIAKSGATVWRRMIS